MSDVCDSCTNHDDLTTLCRECLDETVPVRVIRAAIQNGELTIVAAAGQRHHHLIHALVDLGCSAPIGPALGYVQGFLLSDGTFATRARAEEVARAADQLSGSLKGSVLTSEDLW